MPNSMLSPDEASLYGGNPNAARASCVVYRRHDCTSRHRSFNAMAKCIWRKGFYEPRGEGPYAAVHYCRRWKPGAIVTLFATQAEADQQNGWECGGACIGRHQTVKLVLP